MQHHVVPNPNGGWDVKIADAQRASAHFASKEEAIAHKEQNLRDEFLAYVKDADIKKC